MEFKLILKKLNNTLSEEEATIFWKWYDDSDLHKGYFEKVKQAQQDKALLVDIEKAWKSIENRIKPIAVKKTNYLKYAVAASIALVATITILVKKSWVDTIAEPVIVTNTIKIGTDKATLTLADGTNVALEKGEQYISNNAKSNGEDIVYQASASQQLEIVYNYLTIPRGGQFFIKLSDGTQVWLNSESQLKYPVSFIKGETRKVELVYGEAYFDVSPSTANNGAIFSVYNNEQEVEVLGTKFNIKAYKDEINILTTLVEGKVAIKTDAESNILKPNQQSNLNLNTNVLSIGPVDAKKEVAWKDGIFSFEGKMLKDIMVVLSRWYDIEVVFENKTLETQKFVGIINKNYSIEDILSALINTNVINSYSIENQLITLK